MASTRTTARGTGRFASRTELTCHVWAMYRQQVFPNLSAVSRACGVTIESVKAILENEEGLEDYLRAGCLSGAP